MHRHSPKGPIILGTLLICIIIGVAIVATLNKNVASTIVNQPSTSTTSSAIGNEQATSTIATSTDALSMIKTDTIHKYTINYLPTMSVKDNQEFPPVPGEGLQATVFTFPADHYDGGTTQEANIGITQTETRCSTWADGMNTVAVSDTKEINGHTFEYRVMTGAATSNYYTTYEYSTTYAGQCYRIALFIHSTSPGVEFTDQATIEEKTQNNKDIENRLKMIFEQMVSSFTFTQ